MDRTEPSLNRQQADKGLAGSKRLALYRVCALDSLGFGSLRTRLLSPLLTRSLVFGLE